MENLVVFVSLLGTQLTSVDTNYLSTGLLHTSSAFLILQGWIHIVAACRPIEFIKHFCKTSEDLRNLYLMTVPLPRTSEFLFCSCPQDEGCYREVCVNQVENCLHVPNDQVATYDYDNIQDKITICPDEEKKALVNRQ